MVRDVETGVLTFLLRVTSILVNVLSACLGWVGGTILLNFLVDTFTTRTAYTHGWTAIIGVLCAESQLDHQWLLFMTLLTHRCLMNRYSVCYEEYMRMVNYTLQML
jgi:ABC-type uncharacterized transport system permease subunit